ncbi:MAG: hypothetical protein LAO78_17720 [Acidobacteriia bacterium]|nr:hypothetical protein [Terriglobia bacterium]
MPKLLTTRDVAKRLGISAAALSRYVTRGKVFQPEMVDIGQLRVHSWKEEDVERLRELLPKIANGRKTRHKKKQSPKSSRQSAKAKKEKK